MCRYIKHRTCSLRYAENKEKKQKIKDYIKDVVERARKTVVSVVIPVIAGFVDKIVKGGQKVQ